jgi:hypothetical protein
LSIPLNAPKYTRAALPSIPSNVSSAAALSALPRELIELREDHRIRLAQVAPQQSP